MGKDVQGLDADDGDQTLEEKNDDDDNSGNCPTVCTYPPKPKAMLSEVVELLTIYLDGSARENGFVVGMTAQLDPGLPRQQHAMTCGSGVGDVDKLQRDGKPL